MKHLMNTQKNEKTLQTDKKKQTNIITLNLPVPPMVQTDPPSGTQTQAEGSGGPSAAGEEGHPGNQPSDGRHLLSEPLLVWSSPCPNSPVALVVTQDFLLATLMQSMASRLADIKNKYNSKSLRLTEPFLHPG